MRLVPATTSRRLIRLSRSLTPLAPSKDERNNNIVDMGSNQDPSIGLTKEIASGELEGTVYPFHISEYAHSMGNAMGDLKPIWEAVESSNFICGGAIWD